MPPKKEKKDKKKDKKKKKGDDQSDTGSGADQGLNNGLAEIVDGLETPRGDLDANGISLATESNLSVVKKDKKDKKSKKNQKPTKQAIDPAVLE